MSGARLKQKWRPSLGLIVSAVLAFVTVLPRVGLFFFRLYDNQLIRQTQAELIAQSQVFAAIYAHEVELRRAGGIVLGAEIPPEARPVPNDRFAPIVAALDLVADELLRRPPDAPPAQVPRDPTFDRLGPRPWPRIT